MTERPKKVDGMEAARIAVRRYFKLPLSKRTALLDSGVEKSEILLLMGMDVMFSPEKITEEEWAYLSQPKDIFETEQ